MILNAETTGRTLLLIDPKFCIVGYTARPVQPAKNYDVISFARAMNDDFGPRVKKLFDPEREAALLAHRTGMHNCILYRRELDFKVEKF